jgi:diketogulonate reductase-like aldo/keto reductase
VGENFQRNLRIVDEVEAVAAEAGATPAEIALAWLLTRGDDIAPIPGTKRVARVEENTAADGVALSAEQIERLNNLTRPPANATTKETWPPSTADQTCESGCRPTAGTTRSSRCASDTLTAYAPDVTY